MKSILTAAATAVVLTAGSAMAWEGRTVACQGPGFVGKNGRIELVHYAAVYREYKTKVSNGMWVMKEVSCGCPKC